MKKQQNEESTQEDQEGQEGQPVTSSSDYGKKMPDGQHERHPSLPSHERAVRVRPLRTWYRHRGTRPVYPTRPLTDVERVTYASSDYACFEPYGAEQSPKTGRFWTQAQLDSGCGEVTTMAVVLAETYAARPDYYGTTFCTQCGAYHKVEEFVWVESDGTDGPRVGT